MVKWNISGLVAAFAVLVLCLAAFSEEMKCAGTITKIEGEKVTINTPASGEQTMWVVTATKIMLDGKAAKPMDLKIGQRANCTCNKDGEKMVCNAIEVSSKPE